jgi:CopG antitoxin of type II toxin-antitoxin system
MTKPEKQRRIPDFKSREEAAEWFDTHDIGDYLDEFELVQVTVADDLSNSLSVDLPADIFAQILQRAHDEGVGASTLVRQWILEHLEQQNGRASGH